MLRCVGYRCWDCRPCRIPLVLWLPLVQLSVGLPQLSLLMLLLLLLLVLLLLLLLLPMVPVVIEASDWFCHLRLSRQLSSSRLPRQHYAALEVAEATAVRINQPTACECKECNFAFVSVGKDSNIYFVM